MCEGRTIPRIPEHGDVLGLGAWLFFQIVQQNGRILLQIHGLRADIVNLQLQQGLEWWA
jgi:hypothetical protein